MVLEENGEEKMIRESEQVLKRTGEKRTLLRIIFGAFLYMLQRPVP